jgi:polysaccharide export outer membrane protein
MDIHAGWNFVLRNIKLVGAARLTQSIPVESKEGKTKFVGGAALRSLIRSCIRNVRLSRGARVVNTRGRPGCIKTSLRYLVMTSNSDCLIFAVCWKASVRCAAIVLVTAMLMLAADAQPASTLAKPSGSTAITSVSSEDTRYRIGPGDVLSILVRKAPELSGAVRVDQRGMIRIPMIDEAVRAACRTESELAAQIATLYLEYKNNPAVEVFVSDFQSRPAAVIGAVNAPGQFRLQRRVRLLELLSFAGGPAPRAGRVINIIHAGGPNMCETNGSDSNSDVATQEVSVYKLYDTLKGKEGSNPFVQPGDIVSLLEADQVFVIGHVNVPQAIFLRDQPITISRAIAIAGGPSRDASTSRVRIIRQVNGGDGKQEILVDLKAIQKQKAADILLLPDDIVEVGASTGKTILGILTGVVPAVVSQGVVRAIP